ncbi:MAG: LysR substrate-binding domain-containing protein [Burkholderiaceae bacterium]
MRRLPLQFLPTFRIAAETQNLRATAEALHLTHSAVSQQIRLLEEQLGFEMFERSGRKIRLNAAGEIFLRSVTAGLREIHAGAQAAQASATGQDQQFRLTVLPSFAQRWLLPRMGRWHSRYPRVRLDIEASVQVVDLQEEGFHAGIRTGVGPWAGLVCEPLFDWPMELIVVGCPAAARRLAGKPAQAFVTEALLGDVGTWKAWFEAAGVNAGPFRPVASFNDYGLMLQAAEQNLGLTITRELLATDALADGRLVRLSPVSIVSEDSQPYFFVFPELLRTWEPLLMVRKWLSEEARLSHDILRAHKG